MENMHGLPIIIGAVKARTSCSLNDFQFSTLPSPLSIIVYLIKMPHSHPSPNKLKNKLSTI